MAKRPKVLTKKEITKVMKVFHTWKVNKAGTEIQKTYEFPDFVYALAFVAKVSVHAEVMEHHPVIELSYGKVKIKLSTHEPKGLTKLDFHLAEKIDQIRLNTLV